MAQQESASTHILTTLAPFMRFTDARIGRAFKHAIEALHGDMILAKYEPSDVAEDAFRALATTIQVVLEEEADVEIVAEELKRARPIVEMTRPPADEFDDGTEGLTFPAEEVDDDDND